MGGDGDHRRAADDRSGPARPGWAGAWEVFVVALGLGLTSFGGPVAHIGYFERAYVRRRRWLTAEAYAGAVALCQMLPGPASSQVGVVVGLGRAGWRGGLAAWLGFTAPSALLMFAFGLAAPRLDGPWATAVLHGLKLTAAAIVAQATWSMARRLTPDLTRLAIAGATGVLSLALGGAVAQLGLLAGAAGVGLVVCRSAGPIGAPPTLPIGGRAATLALVVFLAVLAALPLVATAQARGPVALAAAIYQAGALVFGGGHVVLPLLRMALVPHGWLTDSRFLAGYGAAQALPGPLFAFAAFLGESAAPAGSTLAVKAAWAVVALVAIFVPGVLLVVAGAPIWTAVARHPSAQGALSGVNAAVVGILAAALYTPIGTSAITTPADAAIVVAGFSLLVILKSPPLAIVGFCVGMAVALRGLTGAL